MSTVSLWPPLQPLTETQVTTSFQRHILTRITVFLFRDTHTCHKVKQIRRKHVGRLQKRMLFRSKITLTSTHHILILDLFSNPLSERHITTMCFFLQRSTHIKKVMLVRETQTTNGNPSFQWCALQYSITF